MFERIVNLVIKRDNDSNYQLLPKDTSQIET